MSLSEQDHQSLSNVHVGRLGISRLDDLKGLTSDDKHKLIEFIVLTSNKPGMHKTADNMANEIADKMQRNVYHTKTNNLPNKTSSEQLLNEIRADYDPKDQRFQSLRSEWAEWAKLDPKNKNHAKTRAKSKSRRLRGGSKKSRQRRRKTKRK